MITAKKASCCADDRSRGRVLIALGSHTFHLTPKEAARLAVSLVRASVKRKAGRS